MNLLSRLGRVLAVYLSQPSKRGASPATCTPETLLATLKVGDILLVDGDSRVSRAIKYITQSIWSHSALYIGVQEVKGTPQPCLVEADVVEGVRLVPLSQYTRYHTRICRAVGLVDSEIEAVKNYALSRLGHQYDLKNIVDLLRYTIQSPPVPYRWRRKLLAFGSGEPTRAICSSLIAQAFQSIRYPILPDITRLPSNDIHCRDCYEEILHIRHHRLFAPKDFDISPYFSIVKPTIAGKFDHRHLRWSETEEEEAPPVLS